MLMTSGTQELIDYINTLDLDNNEKKNVKSQALGYFTASNKCIQKKMDLKMKKAPYTNTKLSTFELDMAATTAAACIGETEGEFSRTEFQTPKHAHLVKQSLIDPALFKVKNIILKV